MFTFEYKLQMVFFCFFFDKLTLFQKFKFKPLCADTATLNPHLYFDFCMYLHVCKEMKQKKKVSHAWLFITSTDTNIYVSIYTFCKMSFNISQ